MTQAKPLCGFLNVLKPPGMSSAQVVGCVRRLLGGVKAGHAGTLDPEAAGVLPVMVGKAARLFDYLQDKEKEYVAEVAFGVATDTQDAQGVPIAHGDRWPDEAAIAAALPRFKGKILQTPPMYSALKQDGQRLYDLARSGREANVPAREVTVYALDLTGLTPEHGALLRVRCSRGFYVRTLCHDLGETLGCPAHMRFLLREQTGAFDLSTAVTIEQIKAAGAEGTLGQYLIAPDAPLSHLARYDVPERYAKLCMNGVRLRADEWPCHVPCGGYTRLYVQGRFTGISQAAADGTLVPCVVFNNNQEGCTQA